MFKKECTLYEESCNAEGGSAAPPDDGNLAPQAYLLTSSKGLLDPPSLNCALNVER